MLFEKANGAGELCKYQGAAQESQRQGAEGIKRVHCNR